jgi:hypothetical protein
MKCTRAILLPKSGKAYIEPCWLASAYLEESWFSCYVSLLWPKERAPMSFPTHSCICSWVYHCGTVNPVHAVVVFSLHSPQHSTAAEMHLIASNSHKPKAPKCIHVNTRIQTHTLFHVWDACLCLGPLYLCWPTNKRWRAAIATHGRLLFAMLLASERHAGIVRLLYHVELDRMFGPLVGKLLSQIHILLHHHDGCCPFEFS